MFFKKILLFNKDGYWNLNITNTPCKKIIVLIFWIFLEEIGPFVLRKIHVYILEIEQIFSIVVKQDLRKYLHICVNYYESNEEYWQGKVIDLRTSINKLENRLYNKLNTAKQKLINQLTKITKVIKNWVKIWIKNWMKIQMKLKIKLAWWILK